MMTGIARLLPSAAASCGLSLCVFGVLGAVVIAPRPAAAGDASPWNGDARSSVRLVADAPADPASALRAGIELRLEPGWHTYWRYPGDAGVPPHFDFAGSQNVKAVTVLWPAPQRIEEQGMTAI